MDDSACRLWRLLQCLDGDWTLICCSKLLQFRRCESRRVRECLCLCVMCRVRMCHLLNGNVYVMQLQSNWLSAYNTWYSPWTIVPRGPSLWHSVWRRLMNIHVLFVYFMHWLDHLQLIDHIFPLNKWHILTLHITHKHKHSRTLLLSQRLNCRSFEQQVRVQSPSKLCRNLHNRHDESSIASDVHKIKSFLTP